MTKIHIVSHTHWDREWYRPFQHFRTKLVFVIDKIINTLENDPDFNFFLLDGQSIVLDDYLEVKPESYDRLKNLITSGRLIVGPWYIQPDEFAPDGESLVRNLLIGISSVEKFGKSMMVGYLPDSFGQTAQLPQILKGFEIDSAMIMRGIPADELKQSEFIWEGLNGDQILSVYLPYGYENAMFLPENSIKAVARLKEVVRRLKKWSKSGHVLVMNGVDHQFIQPSVPESIKAANKVSLNSKYINSTIQSYIDDVRKDGANFPVLKNDLLATDRKRVHSSIASTRIYQKQKNRAVETLLEKYVEPIATIAWFNQAVYPQALINQAWKILLQNQTHDGICGCCTDRVHQEMDLRFADAEEIGSSLLKSYSRAIVRKIDSKKILLSVFNNAMVQGKQVVKATIFSKNEQFVLKDLKGNEISYQIDAIEEIDAAEMTIWTLYLDTPEPYKKIDILFHVDFNFNIGYRIFEIEEKSKPVEIAFKKLGNDTSCETQFYKIDFNKNGSLNVFDKETNIIFNNLHIFEDCGDAGDTYNFSPVKMDTVITSESSEASIKLTKEDGIMMEYEVSIILDVPETLMDDDERRSDVYKPLPIKSLITVYKDIKRIDFHTEIENLVDYHRLRVLFPVDFLATQSFAETQFGTIKRDVEIDSENWQEKKWKEKPLPIYSMQKFVALNNNEYGLAVLNRGLPEYEIYQYEDHSALAITLVRGVGMLGKPNLLIRPGRPSGILTPTPDAQCHGKQVLEYALYPLNGKVDENNISAEALLFENNGLTVQNCIKLPNLKKKFGVILGMASLETLTSHITDMMQSIDIHDHEILSVSDPRLIFSTVKKSEKDNALIVRLFNGISSELSGVILSVPKHVKEVWITNLNEKAKEKIEIEDDGIVQLPNINGYSTITLKIRQ